MQLRIKAKFFDQILAGEKTSELRAQTPFYARLFANLTMPTRLFMTDGRRRMACQVIALNVIPNRYEEHERPVYLSTPLVYELRVSDPTLLK